MAEKDTQKKKSEQESASPELDKKKRSTKTAAAKKKTAGTAERTEKPAAKKTVKKPAVKEKQTGKEKPVAAEKKTTAKKPEPKKADDKNKAVVKQSGKKEKTKKKPAQTAKEKTYTPRLRELYRGKIVAEMMKRHGYKNVFEVPRLTKIVLNIGMGDALQNSKHLEAAVDDLSIITGQKPVITKARKSISNFKLRAGNPIGCKVTLRRDRMYEFLDRFISIAVPRIRDFRGLSDRAFDGFGNYSIGVREQIIFPEIDYDKVESIHGLDITVVTTATSDVEARSLLQLFGMPFVESEEVEKIAWK